MKQKHTPGRKVRVKGNRVIHTTRGGVYRGDAAERPSGLTTEQAEDQRRGAKIDARGSAGLQDAATVSHHGTASA